MTDAIFWVPAAVAIAAAVLVVTGRHVMHALLYLVAMLLAVALMLQAIGAPFVAVLQIVIYAGAIMVLFVFAVMMFNLGVAVQKERALMPRRAWVGPVALVSVLLAMTAAALWGPGPPAAVEPIGPREVGISLFRPYLLGVEAASLLLLAALVAAFHFRLPLREEESDDHDRAA